MTEPATVACLALSDGAPSELALAGLLERIGGLPTRIFPGARVLIKPNFVAPFPQATTDLAFIEFFVTAVRALQGIPIVGESSGFEFDTRATFEVLGVHEFARRHNVPLINFEEASYREIDLGGGIGRVEIAETAIHADLVINLPVIKGHGVTRMTGAVKNLFGTLSRPSRRRLHARGLHRSIAALAQYFRPKALHIADARRLLTRAVFSEARPLGYVLSSTDPFALDHLGCRLLGVSPGEVRHLEGAPSYEVVGQVPPTSLATVQQDSWSQRLRRAFYVAAYALDHGKSLALGGRSILPALHWRFGVHPELETGLSPEQLAQVAQTCPVGAIDVAAGRIRREVCQPVRCLACHRAHPSWVRLAGLNPPDRVPAEVREGSNA